MPVNHVVMGFMGYYVELKRFSTIYIKLSPLHIQKLEQGSIFPLSMRFVALSKKYFRSKNRRFL